MSVSFMHRGDQTWASYRYRAAAPAAWLGARLNDPSADLLVFAKPMPEDVPLAQGRRYAVDICDAHLARAEYRALAVAAAGVTCPTQTMADLLRAEYGVAAAVIPEAYEFPRAAPHCTGGRLLWYGHPSNLPSLQRVAPALRWPLRVVSGAPGTIPWSQARMFTEFEHADIVLLPATAPYKSANRVVEAVRQGCFVVAEPHPALEDFAGIWVGDIVTGIEWAIGHQYDARRRTEEAQTYVADHFSPVRRAQEWKEALGV